MIAAILAMALVLIVLIVQSGIKRGPSTPPINSTPTPSKSPTPDRAQGFPNQSNTGVPPNTQLTTYSGPCTITDPNTSLDSRDVTCDRLIVAAMGVRITRSKLSIVDVDGSKRSLVVEDSTIDAGDYVGPAVGYGNLTIRRSDIRGGQHSVLCGTNCVIEYSWLHDQSLPAGEERHNNAFLSNGGSDIDLRGNTLHCTPRDNAVGGGCSGDVSLFGDFAPISDVSITGNLFRSTPGGFCLRLGLDSSKKFGRQTTGIIATDNVFERGVSGRCAAFGPLTSVPSDAVWRSNAWEDGARVVLPD